MMIDYVNIRDKCLGKNTEIIIPLFNNIDDSAFDYTKIVLNSKEDIKGLTFTRSIIE